MQFQQSRITSATLLALRENGLYVSQRDGRGQTDLAVEIPYEELLPIRLEYRRSVPLRALCGVGFALLWLVGSVARARLDGSTPGGQPVPDDFLGVALTSAALLVGGLLYAWHNWWHQAVLHTAHLRLLLADRPGDRRQLRQFVALVTDHTKAYLRREYAPINPLGLIEPQLRRLAWLHELNVLDTPEAQALATRLTGKLPGRSFRSLGQRLERPYVN